MKKEIIYVFAIITILNLFIAMPVKANENVAITEESKKSKSEQNFIYIVPMDNKSIQIDYDLKLIIAMRSVIDFEAPTTNDSYAVFDFNGNIIIDYGVYDHIEFFKNYNCIKAKADDKEILLDSKGKKLSFPDGEKFFNSSFPFDDYIVFESDDYFRIIKRETNTEVKILKSDILVLKNDTVNSISQITDEFIIFDTKINTVVFLANGEPVHSFEKKKYYNTQEVEFNFNNPTMPLYFDEKGYALYRNENRICGVIDIYGNIIIKPEFKYINTIGPYLEICKNDKWGVIDYDKNIIIDVQYNPTIQYFGDDIFLLPKNETQEKNKTKLYSPTNPDMYKNILFEPNFLIDYNLELIEVKKNEKYGIMTFDGKIVVLPKYDFMEYREGFYNDMIRVGNLAEDGMGMRYGFIDKEGNLKVPLIYREIFNYSDGLFGACYTEFNEDGNIAEEYYAFLNGNGEVVLTLDKDAYLVYGSMFSEGLCPIIRRGDSMFGKCEYIDKSGQTVISSDEWGNYTGIFKNSLAIVDNAVSGGPPLSNIFAVCGVIKYTKID